MNLESSVPAPILSDGARVPGRPILMALPKGRFLDKSHDLLRSFFPDFNDERGRRVDYWFDNSQRFGAVMMKAPDIARLLADGLLDIGISPSEWCLEQALHAERDLDCVRANLDVISVRLQFFSKQQHWPATPSLRIVTPFPNLARRFFSADRLAEYGYDNVEVIEVRGSVESMSWLADCVGFDCVETGTSIQCHGMHVLATLYDELDLSLWSNRRGAEFLNSAGLFE